MPQRKTRLALVATGLVVLVVLVSAWEIVTRKPDRGPIRRPGGSAATTPQTVPLAVVIPGTAPADVQEIATRLRSSRVGYAVVKSDRTYLIISTGTDSLRLRLDRAEGIPGTGTPTSVTVRLTSSPTGERLLILASTLTRAVDFRFDLDGTTAGIPTLRNPDNLPVAPLPETENIVVLNPAAGQVIASWPLHVAGFARISDAQLTVTVTDVKGRVLGRSYTVVAAGAPSWGSFVADVRLEAAQMPESGFLVFEGPANVKLSVPVRFNRSRTPQLG